MFMLALRRNFDFKTTDALDAPATYDELLTSLCAAVAEWLDESGGFIDLKELVANE